LIYDGVEKSVLGTLIEQALALDGRDRDEVLSAILQLLADREMGPAPTRSTQ
jgi:hypothetical protein